MEPNGNILTSRIQQIGLLLGPAAFLSCLGVEPLGGEHPQLNHVLGVTLLMVIYWFTEAIPIAVTALIPFVLFPALGVLSARDTARHYMSSTLFLFMGGFLMSLAMERWNLHKRIALHVILKFNRSHSQIVFGFMLTAASLSMWTSNTATAAMMLPVCLALLKQVNPNPTSSDGFSKSLLIGVAWACSIGGIATTVGTPPNLFFLQIYRERFPDHPEVSLASWMKFGVPMSILILICAWLILTQFQFKLRDHQPIRVDGLRKELENLGPIQFEEKVIAAVFLALIGLWVFRLDLDLGMVTIPGWSALWSGGRLLDDGSVAILCALLLFCIPTRQKSSRILDSTVISKIPWDIILLFGGGFALAEGFEISGLSQFLSQQLQGFQNMPVFAMFLLIALLITFMSEVASNVSVAQITIPIMISFSQTLGTGFALPLMLTATLAASMGFMLPIATAPNAIMFSSKRFTMWEMTKGGFFLNIISCFVISLILFWMSR